MRFLEEYIIDVLAISWRKKANRLEPLSGTTVDKMCSLTALFMLTFALHGQANGSGCSEIANWAPSLMYSGQKSVTSGKTSSPVSDKLACVSYCLFNGDKVAIIYDPNTGLCTCHNLPLSLMTLTPAPGAAVFGDDQIHTDTVVSWVTGIIQYSSYFRVPFISSYPATRMIGPPDAYPSYGNDENAWCPKERSANEFVEVSIDEEIYIYELHIYEVFYAGGVETVSIRDPNSNWIVVWKTPQLQIIEESRIFIPKFVPPNFKSKAVRIDLDLDTTNVWSEFDAVRVIGSRTRTRTHLLGTNT